MTPRIASSILLAALTLFVTGGAISAQVGTSVPHFELEDLGGTPAKSFDDFAGRVVLLVYFEPHVDAADLKPIDDVARELGEKGLSVLGITSAPLPEAKAWVEKVGFAHAWAREPSGELMAAMNQRTAPALVMLDLEGKVGWVGKPASLSTKIFPRVLEGAVPRPLWEWPAEAQPVVDAMREAAYAKAVKAARTMKTEDTDLQQAIHDSVGFLVTRKVNALQRSLEAGDYLGVETRGKELVKALANTPDVGRAERILADLEKAPMKDEVLRAQQQLERLMKDVARAESDRSIDVVVRKIQQAVKGVDDTYPKKQAERMLAALEAKRKKVE